MFQHILSFLLLHVCHWATLQYAHRTGWSHSWPGRGEAHRKGSSRPPQTHCKMCTIFTCTNETYVHVYTMTHVQPEEFLNSSPEQRMALKHSLQLERFKIYFQVKITTTHKEQQSSVYISYMYIHTTLDCCSWLDIHTYIYSSMSPMYTVFYIVKCDPGRE